ncbi:MAG TPA: chromate resistance protein ChrB domain-containing protein [Stellaceae bacterium]|jgi:rhodanese-related sulfurtransferase
MDQTGRFSISPQALYRKLGAASSPIVVDVRPAPTFAAQPAMIVGAVQREPGAVERWRRDLPAGRAIVVYCGDGLEVSEHVTAKLLGAGCDAVYLEGGLGAWSQAGLPRRRRLPSMPRIWITRERPKIDRIACPWLIRRFINPEAAIVYVPRDQVAARAAEVGATPFDIPDVEFGHHGEQCSFDAFLAVFAIEDRPLQRLAAIVRGADTGKPALTPQSDGLLALSQGLSAIFADDHEMLAHGMTVYDALYAWCRDAAGAP